METSSDTSTVYGFDTTNSRTPFRDALDTINSPHIPKFLPLKPVPTPLRHSTAIKNSTSIKEYVSPSTNSSIKLPPKALFNPTPTQQGNNFPGCSPPAGISVQGQQSRQISPSTDSVHFPKALFNSPPTQQQNTLPGGSPSAGRSVQAQSRQMIHGHSVDKLIEVGLVYINGCQRCKDLDDHRRLITTEEYMASSGGGHTIFNVSLLYSSLYLCPSQEF